MLSLLITGRFICLKSSVITAGSRQVDHGTRIYFIQYTPNIHALILPTTESISLNPCCYSVHIRVSHCLCLHIFFAVRAKLSIIGALFFFLFVFFFSSLTIRIARESHRWLNKYFIINMVRRLTTHKQMEFFKNPFEEFYLKMVIMFYKKKILCFYNHMISKAKSWEYCLLKVSHV